MKRRYRGWRSYKPAAYVVSANRVKTSRFEGTTPQEATSAILTLERRQRETEAEKSRGFPDQQRLELAARNHARYVKSAEEERNAPPRFFGIFRSAASKREEAELRRLAAESLRVARQLDAAKSAWDTEIDTRLRSLAYELTALRQILRRSATETEKADRERRLSEQEASRKERERQQRELMTARLAAADRLSRELAQKVRNRIAKGIDCPYCGQPLKDPECDHIIPISKGGLSTMGNMVFVCRPCNQAKSDKSLRQFSKSLGYDYLEIVQRLERSGKDI